MALSLATFSSCTGIYILPLVVCRYLLNHKEKSLEVTALGRHQFNFSVFNECEHVMYNNMALPSAYGEYLIAFAIVRVVCWLPWGPLSSLTSIFLKLIIYLHLFYFILIIYSNIGWEWLCSLLWFMNLINYIVFYT